MGERKVKLKRIVEFEAAWDERSKDPDKDYGIHGVEIRFVLKGPDGAVQFLLSTGWMLLHVQKELKGQGDKYLNQPFPADLGYHSLVPRYEGQEAITDSCPYLDDKPCYYDGSGLDAKRVWKRLLEEGDEGVWDELEKYYQSTFGEEPEVEEKSEVKN